MAELTNFVLMLVEDEQAELSRLRRHFRRTFPHATIITATTPTAAANQFRKHRPEVVVLDLSLSGYGPDSGLDLIGKISSIDPTARIITLTGHTSEETGIQAIRNGAASFLTKPTPMVALTALVTDFAQTAIYRRSASIQVAETDILPGFVGSSPAMLIVYRLIRNCATSNANVLIVGETGTGKELVAQAIHCYSQRKNGPLSVYFGSAPGSLAESELFGHVGGAYTGAKKQGGAGCIEKANSGTLFIDELCSLDLSIQRKLLRAVETKTYKPLGAEKYHRSDFRLVCAAQPRIYDLVRTQQFREDLLARVEVLTIKLPPLRERREDIMPLAEHFRELAMKDISHNGVQCSIWGFTRNAQRAFLEYAWPRNLRQLKHVVHNGVIQARMRGSDVVDFVDVEPRLIDENSTQSEATSEHRAGETLRDSVERLERSLIEQSLTRNRNVLSSVCQELGIGRTTLWRKLKQYQLEQGSGNN